MFLIIIFTDFRIEFRNLLFYYSILNYFNQVIFEYLFYHYCFIKFYYLFMIIISLFSAVVNQVLNYPFFVNFVFNDIQLNDFSFLAKNLLA